MKDQKQNNQKPVQKQSPSAKVPYAMKVLEDALRKNEHELEFWKKHLGKNIPQVEGNVSPCENRIEQIKEVILILKQPKDES